jgi:uncharacterized protein (TIGR00369 family)
MAGLGGGMKGIGPRLEIDLMSDTKLLPFAKSMGLEIIEATTERALARVKISQEFCNRTNTASGGLIMALADELGNMLASARLPEGTYASSIDSNTNFISSIPQGEIALVECSLLFHEQKQMVWQTKVTRTDGRLAAIVSQTQLINPSGF